MNGRVVGSPATGEGERGREGERARERERERGMERDRMHRHTYLER
jgi:hypothetical protein